MPYPLNSQPTQIHKDTAMVNQKVRKVINRLKQAEQAFKNLEDLGIIEYVSYSESDGYRVIVKAKENKARKHFDWEKLVFIAACFSVIGLCVVGILGGF